MSARAPTGPHSAQAVAWKIGCVRMTTQLVELRFAGNNGHTATFRYGLSETHGWDVRAELDHRVIATRHCRNWSGVEGLYEWLLAMLQKEELGCSG